MHALMCMGFLLIHARSQCTFLMPMKSNSSQLSLRSSNTTLLAPSMSMRLQGASGSSSSLSCSHGTSCKHRKGSGVKNQGQRNAKAPEGRVPAPRPPSPASMAPAAKGGRKLSPLITTPRVSKMWCSCAGRRRLQAASNS